MSYGLPGFYECPADIVISDQTKIKRYIGFIRISKRSGHSGIRDGYDDICIDAIFSGELPAKLFSYPVYINIAEYIAVRS